MTIPSTIFLPEYNSQDQNFPDYMQELIFTLQRMYEQIADGVNGNILANFLEQGRRWTPVIRDTANAGTTFTYDHQIGWVFRKGIITDVWFDVSWTANSGAITGNMYVELPYKVAVTNQKPFVGVVQPSGITYTGGTECVVNAISDTYRAEIWNTGSGFTTANQASASAGQLIGHLRYIGQDNE